MYEVEFKVELNKNEETAVIAKLLEIGFEDTGITPQNDHYIHAVKSPYGGYDLRRYRNEAGTYIYTEKIWEMVNETKARKEDEYEVTEEEFNIETEKYPNAMVIKKDRHWFKGLDNKVPISVTIDTAKFNHCDYLRFFIEAEIDTEDKSKVAEIKEHIIDFLKRILEKEELIESPGMFTMAFEKR